MDLPTNQLSYNWEIARPKSSNILATQTGQLPWVLPTSYNNSQRKEMARTGCIKNLPQQWQAAEH